ncbi:hypothetical protein CJP74_01875 [Psittacicella melopsittaci]|uniref:Type I restriction modification DNA specificity domain-containing protein n=2 Tax=Psittacicella melopsittaci TaxID=2028576 RepID=A0A3A1Y570_9GAMM|nr:hypothetical protein CJP74_01875 [Psittacicella melopsittaci]
MTFVPRSENTFEFIGRTQVNYGVQGYINKIDTEPNEANCISISQIGASQAQIRKHKWYSSSNIFILTPKIKELLNQFTITSINHTLTKYKGYTNFPTLDKFKNETILLPRKKGVIDFEFIEGFITELESLNRAKIQTYLQTRGLDNYQLSEKESKALEEFNNIEWKEFKINELFTSQSGDFDIQKKHINELGDYVITAGLNNNGIFGKTDVKAKIIPGNTITIDMFGHSFYRQFQYKMVRHARVFALIPKFNMSQNQGLFFSNSFRFLTSLFSYNNMCSWDRIQNLNILLPTKNSQVDFEFIETYILALEKLVIKDLVQFTNNKTTSSQNLSF